MESYRAQGVPAEDLVHAGTQAKLLLETESAISGPLSILKKAETTITAVGWGAMFVIMVLVTTDVCLRYLLNAPLRWSFDFITLYLMPMLFFFGLADTLRSDGHVAVDILYTHLSGRRKAGCDVCIYAISVVVFAVLLYASGQAALDSFARRETLSGLIAWPVWASYAIAPIGTIPILLLCIIRFFESLSRLFVGDRFSDRPV
jgi:TRAP-type C4-dicarboxylate transport system permease small subunit